MLQRRPRLIAVAVLASAGLLALAPTASAKKSEDTAHGRCTMTGQIVFGQPVGLLPLETSFTDYAEGTCTGTVNGEFLASERAYLRAQGSGLLGCSANRVTDEGTLFFTRNTKARGDDVEIDYIAQSQGVFGQNLSRLRGRVSGELVGYLAFRGDEEVIAQCSEGMFRGGIYDTTGQTITPLVG